MKKIHALQMRLVSTLHMDMQKFRWENEQLGFISYFILFQYLLLVFMKQVHQPFIITKPGAYRKVTVEIKVLKDSQPGLSQFCFNFRCIENMS